MRRFLYDTSIFAYALGADHPYQGPCREIVRRAASGELQGEASSDLLQELIHQRTRRTGDRPGAAKAVRNVAKLVWWHRVEPNDVQRGIDLFETHPGLGARDAVFARPGSQPRNRCPPRNRSSLRGSERPGAHRPNRRASRRHVDRLIFKIPQPLSACIPFAGWRRGSWRHILLRRLGSRVSFLRRA